MVGTLEERFPHKTSPEGVAQHSSGTFSVQSVARECYMTPFGSIIHTKCYRTDPKKQRRPNGLRCLSITAL